MKRFPLGVTVVLTLWLASFPQSALGQPLQCDSIGAAPVVTGKDLLRLLQSQSSVRLYGARVSGDWPIVPSRLRATEFRCARCCFEKGLRIVDQSVDLLIDLDESQFQGMLFVNNVQFKQPFLVRRSVFSEGVQVFGSRFLYGLDAGEATFRGPVQFEGSAADGLVDLADTTFDSAVSFLHMDFSNSLHWEQASFKSRVTLTECFLAGALLTRGAVIRAPWSIVRSNLLAGADFRFSRFFQCSQDKPSRRCDPESSGSLNIEETVLAGALSLRSVEVDPPTVGDGRTTHALRMAESSIASVEGLGWQALRNLMEPTLGDLSANSRTVPDTAATLRQIERSFGSQGLGSDAAEAELYRRHLDARQEGGVAILGYYFMRLTNGYGHQLWRMPAWCLICISAFGLVFKLEAKRAGKNRTRSRVESGRSFIFEFTVSFRVFANLLSPQDAQELIHNKKWVRRLAEFEQILGFVSLLVTTAVIGGYVSA